jgi:hypothetical protein
MLALVLEPIEATAAPLWLDAMQWAVPSYPKNQVDWAGQVLALETTDPFSDDWFRAYQVIDNWRSSHNYPLNTFQVTLRTKARKVDPNCVVAQRIKRLSSIGHKLSRFKSMQLSQMQDIGGCRAIVETVQNVEALVESYKKSDLRHKLYRVTDYVRNPRTSGYRGVHLLYQYFSDKESKSVYNGLRLEMQIRSGLQHAWATAVETVGTITSQALKSSLGETDWLRFFSLMGSVIARREDRPLIPGTPSNKDELMAELQENAQRLNASFALHMFGRALKTLEQPGVQKAHFFLLELNPKAQEMKITGFELGQSELAASEYTKVERIMQENPESGSIAVLVSVDNVAALRRAYPNYFLDTSVFADILDGALAGSI